MSISNLFLFLAEKNEVPSEEFKLICRELSKKKKNISEAKVKKIYVEEIYFKKKVKKVLNKKTVGIIVQHIKGDNFVSRVKFPICFVCRSLT